MSAQQDVITTICPSTPISSLLRKDLDHVRKIWKAWWRRLVELAIAQTYLEKGIGISSAFSVLERQILQQNLGLGQDLGLVIRSSILH